MHLVVPSDWFSEHLDNQNTAVIRFSDWLATLTVERENGDGGGAGSAQIVLCGHRYEHALGFVSDSNHYFQAWEVFLLQIRYLNSSRLNLVKTILSGRESLRV